MKQFAIATILGAATPLAAQQVDANRVEACFAAAGPGESAPQCLGQAAGACVEAGNDTTLGTSTCIQSETAAWDVILNREYKAVRTTLKAQDPALADMLLQAQRAWIAYRDAECALEYGRWGGGSIRTIVGANCMMLETAERAIELRDKKGF